jgi:hypothetical protein
MPSYKPACSRKQQDVVVPQITDEDIEAALADFSARRNSPVISDCFTAVACLAQREREAALTATRKAWVAGLCRHGADALHAVAFTMREEFRVRETMRVVDTSYRSAISGGRHGL